MVKLGAEDIVFFLSIGLILFILLWILTGSPTQVSALVSIGGLFVTAGFSLWQKYFKLDKNFTVAFNKVKHDFEMIRNDMKYFRREMKIELDNIKEKLNKIENLIKKK